MTASRRSLLLHPVALVALATDAPKTFHDKGGRGGRTNGAKRSVVIDILGLPLAVSGESARPHDVSAGRRLLDTTMPALGTVQAIVADRGYRGLGKMAIKKRIRLDIKAPPKGTSGFTPIAPLYHVEHAFARLVARSRCGRLPVRAPPSGTAVGSSHGIAGPVADGVASTPRLAAARSRCHRTSATNPAISIAAPIVPTAFSVPPAVLK